MHSLSLCSSCRYIRLVQHAPFFVTLFVQAEKFEKLFVKYAESNLLPLEQLVFWFDGQKVLASSTPADLDIEDEDIIEVNLRM